MIGLIAKMEIKRLLRSPTGLLYAVGVFILALSVLPMGMPHGTELSSSIVTGLLWSVLFIVSSLSLANLFRSDQMSGMLTQMVLLPTGVLSYAVARWIVAWLFYHGSLLMAVPLLGLFYGLEEAVLLPLIGTLALGTLSLSLLQTVAASITLGGKRSAGFLALLLILPLASPILILGSQAMHDSLGFVGLMGILLVYIPLLLPLTAWILKVQVKN